MNNGIIRRMAEDCRDQRDRENYRSSGVEHFVREGRHMRSQQNPAREAVEL